MQTHVDRDELEHAVLREHAEDRVLARLLVLVDERDAARMRPDERGAGGVERVVGVHVDRRRRGHTDLHLDVYCGQRGAVGGPRTAQALELHVLDIVRRLGVRRPRVVVVLDDVDDAVALSPVAARVDALGQGEHPDEARAVAIVDGRRDDAVGLQRRQGPLDAELVVEDDQAKGLGQDLVAGP